MELDIEYRKYRRERRVGHRKKESKGHRKEKAIESFLNTYLEKAKVIIERTERKKRKIPDN